MTRIDIDRIRRSRIGARQRCRSTRVHERTLWISFVGSVFYLTNPTNPTIFLEMPMNPDVFFAVHWSGRCPEPDQATENPTNSRSTSNPLVITIEVAR